ncbi:MAG TPA: S8 family peptidase [Bacteroidota bacterium]|nr:S8 family peptidase [Bacteroidota bacterium]
MVPFVVAQGLTSHYWIMLPDKKVPSSVSPQSLGISERAIQRRSKSFLSAPLIDLYDYPVSPEAIAQAESCGVVIRFASRWLNAISVEATPEQVQMLSAAMHANIIPVKKLVRQANVSAHTMQAVSSFSKASTTSSFRKKSLVPSDYGYSETQLANIKVTDLHALGVIGGGVLIGMLDDGFNNYRTHPALKTIDVLATHDFIHNIDDVTQQSWEKTTAPSQGNHGEGTLSAIGGYDPGNMIGAAYGASFILAKTEMDSSGNDYDFHSEEDTYVAALEWMERLGVDVTSSSLAYKEFSDTLSNGIGSYTWQNLDGRTTKVAQAAIIAARKGVLVVTAMGNEGSQTGKGTAVVHEDTTLWSPADADSILAVGATSSNFTLTYFSGCGPTADGRIKPDVVAQGLDVFWASDTSSYISVSGTSCSTPLVAGAAACILSAHPTWNAQKVRSAIFNTAVHYNDSTAQTETYPNNYYGYGVLDALSAVQYYGPIEKTTPTAYKLYANYPNPFNNSTIIKFDMPNAGNVTIDVYNILGQHIKNIFSGYAVRTDIVAPWNGTSDRGRIVASGVYFYRVKSGNYVATRKMLFLK